MIDPYCPLHGNRPTTYDRCSCRGEDRVFVPTPEDSALDNQIAIEAIKRLHRQRKHGEGMTMDFVHFGQTEFPDLCDHCRTAYPCETARLFP